MNTDRINEINQIRAAIKQVTSLWRKDFPNFKKPSRRKLIRWFYEKQGYVLIDGVSMNLQIIELWKSKKDQFVFREDPGFYLEEEWKTLRRKVIKRYGSICMKCGSVDCISVDHIKPRSLFPELELDEENLQVLCKPCNSSKSNREIVDYR